MDQIVPRLWRMVLVLAFASLFLTGCPKKTTPGAGADVAASPGGSTTGTAPSGLGGAAGSGQTPGATVASNVTGTTLPALPSPTEFVETSMLRDIQFDFDRYEIRSPDRATLDADARWLKANPKTFVLIEGHCDERGTSEYNLALGERRARATRDYLLAAGISGTRVTVVSYGKERPVCTEGTEVCWARNRRTHFLVKP